MYLDALSVDERSALWRRSIGAGTTAVFVAEDSAMRGWISIGRSRDAVAHPATGEVWALYVLPESWERGVARALWSAARSRFLADGMTVATLWVFTDNARARAAYERLGWRLEPESEKSFDLAGATMREVRYRIDLV